MMDFYNTYTINPCQSLNYCSNLDDFRPIQSSLLTRFTTKDSSESWRTTNQEYGSFYYQSLPHSCIPDNLKAKAFQRQNRFQDWLLYQNSMKSCKTKSNNNNCNNQTIFPPDRKDTVRITHRKTFSPTCNEEFYNNQQQNAFPICGEDGLIIEFIVKKILNKLQGLITPDEYHDVCQCAQLLVNEILIQEPCLLIDDIVDRVITIMITPPNEIDHANLNPCYSYISTNPISCPPVQSSNDHCQPTKAPNVINHGFSLCTDLHNSTIPTNCNQISSLSSVLDKLTRLENAISKISNELV